MKRLILLILFISVASLNAQPINFSLKRGNWTGGISGNISWDNYDRTIKEINGDVKSTTTEYGSQLNFKSGYFAYDNFLIGLLYFQTIDEVEITPDPNPNGNFDKTRTNTWFAGLWTRYYVPISSINFALFGEISLGYLVYQNQNQNLQSNLYTRSFTRADGFAYIFGAGISYFVTDQISTELALNFQSTNPSGTVEYNSNISDGVDFSIFNTKLLLGIQIYLPN